MVGKTEVSVLPHGAVTLVVEQTRVDVNGNFQFDDIQPGNYTVIVPSSHSNAMSLRDALGSIVCIPLQIKAGHTSDASHNFPATVSSL
jgi:hypothetical protein